MLGIFDFGGEQDRSGAGAEGGLEADELFQLFETFFSQQFQERAGFAAGDYQAIDVVELFGLFDEHNFGAQLFEPAAVGVEIALQGLNQADAGLVVYFVQLVLCCWGWPSVTDSEVNRMRFFDMAAKIFLLRKSAADFTLARPAVGVSGRLG